MRRSSKDNFKVVGHTNVSGTSEGCFCVPIFMREGDKSGSLFVQLPDARNLRVERFCKTVISENFCEADCGSVTTKVGDEIVYLFSWSGKLYCGPLDKIRKVLLRYCSFENNSPDVVLQIGELIDATNIRISARQQLIKSQTENSAGVAEAIAFLREDIRSSAWARILTARSSDSEAKKLLTQLQKISTIVLPDGAVRVRVEEGLNVDIEPEFLEKLQNLLSDEFVHFRDLFISGKFSTKASVSPSRRSSLPDIISKFDSATRQEQRTAILVAALLSYPQNCQEILEKYSRERASYAREARKRIVRLVENYSTDFDRFPLPQQLIRVILAIVWKSYERTVSRHRAWLLLELARTCDDVAVWRFVEMIALRSGSYWMEPVLKCVRERLLDLKK